MAFLCFNKGNNRLGIKKGLKIAILTLFLAFFLFSTTRAQQIPYFYDDFEKYNLGDLPTTNDPNDTSKYYYLYYGSNPQVINQTSHSGTKSIVAPNNSYSIIETTPAVFTTSTEGQVSIWMKTQKKSNYPVFDFSLRPNLQNLNCGIEETTINGIHGIYYYGTSGWIFWLNPEYDQWNKYTIKFKVEADQHIYCKYIYNENYSETDWIDRGGTYPYITRVFFSLFNDNYQNTWIDDLEIGYKITAEPSGYYLVWNLEKPTPCQFPEPSIYNQVSTTTNFEVKGSLGIPSDNPYVWYHLRLKFWNWNTNKILFFDYDLPNLKSNQTYNFDYFLDISSILSTSTDLINFSLMAYGKDNSGNVYEDLYPPVCEIFLGLTPEQPVFIPPEEECPSQPELEDCSQYNIPDRWICEIKNALKSIFLPTCEKLMELKRTTDLFKQKFPFNYINLFTSFYQDINNGINETSTIPFKILGQSGNVDLAFWENQTTIGGITQTFSHIIYNIFLFLLLFVFVLWLISYLKRIF
jgi:hypothetical protein